MKRSIFAIILVLLLIFTFAACGGKNKNDLSEDNSGIIEGVGDSTLDIDDIFDNNSENDNGGENSNSSSAGDSSSNDASSDSSEVSSSSDESSSLTSSSVSQGGNTDVSIDYEDPSVWTEPVGGQ